MTVQGWENHPSHRAVWLEMKESAGTRIPKGVPSSLSPSLLCPIFLSPLEEPLSPETHRKHFCLHEDQIAYSGTSPTTSLPQLMIQERSLV
jgi:hypothetical protein